MVPPWTSTDITPSKRAAGDEIGAAISANKDLTYAVIGAPGVDGDRGTVYVATRSGEEWTLEPMSPPDLTPGDRFGQAVAVPQHWSGDFKPFAAGAPGEDRIATDAGLVYVHGLQGTWRTIPPLGQDAHTGWGGDTLLIRRGADGFAIVSANAPGGPGLESYVFVWYAKPSELPVP